MADADGIGDGVGMTASIGPDPLTPRVRVVLCIAAGCERPALYSYDHAGKQAPLNFCAEHDKAAPPLGDDLMPHERAQVTREEMERIGAQHPSKVVPPTSKATGPNPKDIAGRARVALTLYPPIALVHAVDAMTDGADKYDPFNWRAKDIAARSYIDAAKRHLDAWLEGEECARDSGAKHLGHAIATIGILLDAQAHGCLIDDRHALDGGEALAGARAQVESNIAARRALRAGGAK